MLMPMLAPMPMVMAVSVPVLFVQAPKPNFAAAGTAPAADTTITAAAAITTTTTLKAHGVVRYSPRGTGLLAEGAHAVQHLTNDLGTP